MAGNLINRLSESSKQPTPEVGMGVTFLYYSDRAAGTVVKVCSDRKILVKPDRAIRTDNNGMSESQSYLFEVIEDAKPIAVTKRKDGSWRVSKEGTGVAIGYRSYYHDFSF